jgi:DNA replication protein DnaD
MNGNSIELLSREEAEQLVGRAITQYEWEQISDDLLADDDLFTIIDTAVKEAVDRVIL